MELHSLSPGYSSKPNRRSSLTDVRRLSFPRKRPIGARKDSTHLNANGTAQAFRFLVAKPGRLLSGSRLGREIRLFVHVPTQMLLVEHGQSSGSIWYDSIPCSRVTRMTVKPVLGSATSSKDKTGFKYEFRLSIYLIAGLKSSGESKSVKSVYYFSSKAEVDRFMHLVRNVNRFANVAIDIFHSFHLSAFTDAERAAASELLKIELLEQSRVASSLEIPLLMPATVGEFLDFIYRLFDKVHLKSLSTIKNVLQSVCDSRNTLDRDEASYETNIDTEQDDVVIKNPSDDKLNSVMTSEKVLGCGVSEVESMRSTSEPHHRATSILPQNVPISSHPLVANSNTTGSSEQSQSRTTQNKRHGSHGTIVPPNLETASCHSTATVINLKCAHNGNDQVGRCLSNSVSSIINSTNEFLVEGESYHMVEHNVAYLEPAEREVRRRVAMSRRWCEVLHGCIVVTNWRVRFLPYDHSSPFDIPTTDISQVCICQSTSRSCVMFATKQHMREHRFLFDHAEEWVEKVVQQLSKSCPPSSHTKWFAFSCPTVSIAPLYRPDIEWSRQCSRGTYGPSLRQLFHLYHDNYSLSATYPSKYLLPNGFSKEDLSEVAKFRSRGRVPAITWVNSITGAVLARSSQPKSGMSGHRCPQDEVLLRCYSKSSGTARPFYIVDARGISATLGNTVMGKGSESSSNYDNAHILFSGIANIHTMRSSFDRLSSLCKPGAVDESDSKWLSKIEATGWLSHVRRIIVSGMRLAEVLHKEGSSCLVHCSDGWDRTSQIVALAQVLLDPYYRTMEGFALLIEKDWVSFGHQFADRLGWPNGKCSDEQRSPVFIQWLDTVYQVWRQCKNSFEFTEDFLLDISMHLYSGRYTTFMWNTEKQSREGLNQQPVWQELLSTQNQERYRNSTYDPSVGVVWPQSHPKFITLWERYHLLAEPLVCSQKPKD